MTPLGPVARVGRSAIGALGATGRLALFGGNGLARLARPPFPARVFGRVFLQYAFFSLPVVALTAVFSGMVIALQSHTGFSRYSAGNAVAGVVALSVVRELGPVLAGLMVAGRVGAATAAELGTMRVTDQIDALSTLSTDPIRHLVAPRLLAGMLALPLLVVVSDTLGVLGGLVVGVSRLGFAAPQYMRATLDALRPDDVLSGLLKAAAFGFLIALLGCFHGMRSRGGAQGVGAATTAAVVSASILILASDYVLTALLFAR